MTSKKLSSIDGTDHFYLTENCDSGAVDQKHETRRHKVLNIYMTIETIKRMETGSSNVLRRDSEYAQSHKLLHNLRGKNSVKSMNNDTATRILPCIETEPTKVVHKRVRT